MILDTNAISGLLAGDADLEVVLAVAERHHLPVVVLGEYRFGLIGSRYRKDLERQLDILERESFVLCLDPETARLYAAVRHELKQQGTPIPENDLWVAALARQYNQTIVSRDGHFDWVPGVRRIGW